MKLIGMISTAPEDLVIEEAQALDAERSSTDPRSPLHGIPMTSKDLICTGRSLGMATTSGLLALKEFMAKKTQALQHYSEKLSV
ncbi:hypothetical protein BKA64DRAFT_672346 [Cadophora sp. MPI-SDFR-AT-0126]|nr:hypothetical protein BKA64DRAFT_672346 [Leotiomycetes sp. MPI-SDFR-AT-0126]